MNNENFQILKFPSVWPIYVRNGNNSIICAMHIPERDLPKEFIKKTLSKT